MRFMYYPECDNEAYLDLADPDEPDEAMQLIGKYQYNEIYDMPDPGAGKPDFCDTCDRGNYPDCMDGCSMASDLARRKYSSFNETKY